MAFTVLSDTAIKTLLQNIQPKDLDPIQSALRKAFITYSLENEQEYQPHRASVTRPSGQTTLFMPTTSTEYVGAKIIGIPPPDSTGKTLTGVLVLCDTEGKPIGIMNAQEVTAFRTALGSMPLLQLRNNVENIVGFGAGKQAFWHVRLALLLRPGEVKRITIVNRSQERSLELVEKLAPYATSPVQVTQFDPTKDKRDSELKELIMSANVIFCTTPAKTPLFPHHYLDEAIEQGKGPYIAAIGSYHISMSELDPKLFSRIVKSQTSFNPRGDNGGVIVVDSVSGCEQEAGEIVQGKVSENQMIEIGQLLHILDEDSRNSKAKEEWVKTGLVVYKSVGMGVMDLAVGGAVLELAKSKNTGDSLGAL
ncbi:hypothetical protein N0V90_008665 [Kalmusia sp. IMI 367209]|nr:hypothetical protein N0V90_008665 [Kalmusia sp. IMI 367209]